jgi:hypothetical protein
MQVDRQTLIKLLETFMTASEGLSRELEFYRGLFIASCKAKGLDDEQTQKIIDAAREKFSPMIDDAHRSSYLGLLERLPQLVDLLASDQDEALRFLKEWIPKGSIQ